MCRIINDSGHWDREELLIYEIIFVTYGMAEQV